MSKPTKLPSGNWRIQWVDSTGARQGATFAIHAEAVDALRQREAEVTRVKRKLARPRHEKTLAELVPDWLARRPTERRAEDEQALRIHIVPELGGVRLYEMTPERLELFARHLEAKPSLVTRTKWENGKRVGVELVAGKKPLARKTVKNILIVLCKFLADHDHRVRLRYKVQASSYAWIRNPADVARFLDACRPEWFRVACALSLYSGMRLGEAAGLRRDAILWDQRLIRVDRSFGGPTKGRAERFVPLPDELASILRPWLLTHPGPLVWTADGEPLEAGDSLSARTRRTCARLGLEPLRFHDLRHTAGSHLAATTSLWELGAILGHKSPLTTQKYAHLSAEHIARQDRVRLTFAAPSGKVLAFPDSLHTNLHTAGQETGEDEPKILKTKTPGP